MQFWMLPLHALLDLHITADSSHVETKDNCNHARLDEVHSQSVFSVSTGLLVQNRAIT